MALDPWTENGDDYSGGRECPRRSSHGRPRLRGKNAGMADSHYTTTAILLHWLCALLLFCGFGLGLFMTGLEFSPTKFRLYAWHKWVGITVFLLAAARLAWRAAHRPPALPASLPPWQMRASRAAHALLYVLMLGIPLSGWIYSS